MYEQLTNHSDSSYPLQRAVQDYSGADGPLARKSAYELLTSLGTPFQ